MANGAKFAVMADIDYDEFKFFNFVVAVSSKDCGLFLSGLVYSLRAFRWF
jgi:hypothetical protein